MVARENRDSNDLIEKNDLIDIKNGVLKHYTDEQGSSSTRLIGFFAALFALTQGLQRASDGRSISKAFPAIDAWLQGQGLSSLPEQLKLLLVFATFSVLLTFVFRAIFRFAIYGLMASSTLAVGHALIRKATEEFVNRENVKPIHSLEKITIKDVDLHLCVHLGVTEDIRANKRKIFLIFPAIWFSEAYRNCKEKYGGWIVCFSASVIMTFVVLWFFW